ncbi:flagellar motor switch protein FliM [Bosea caraganae]|uniref:Flagellar motor switch protein FliM n=1 Tax=Bosea caraganae TaxID=2763117 RepID=A0A370LD32_9HYPH|nr:FliM/FliN family flagellar motor switch protein [Bosea caraganae]RDJ27419.1 flagellar motor switch protein FliM [Bosea caraganae]RDJ29435.1 flagellar motor switch protein FliM [Bosea caraganae]
MSATQVIREDKLLESTGISIDRLPMLQLIFDRLSTSCADAVRQMSSSPAYFSFAGVQSQRIGEALGGHTYNAIAGIFHSPEWDSRILIGFDRDVIFTLLEVLFGADGSEPAYKYEPDFPDDERPYTNIETQVAQAVFELVAKNLKAAFAPVCDTSFHFERIESRMDFAAIGSRSNLAVKAQFLIQGLDNCGGMFIVIPQTALNPFRQNLARVLSGSAVRDPRWSKQIQSKVQRTEVKLSAILEERSISLGEISALQIGQVLELQASPRSLVRLQCNDETVFWCQLGQRDGSYVLKIQDSANYEQEFLDDLLSR